MLDIDKYLICGELSLRSFSGDFLVIPSDNLCILSISLSYNICCFLDDYAAHPDIRYSSGNLKPSRLACW